MPLPICFLLAMAFDTSQAMRGVLALDRALGASVARNGLAAAVGRAVGDSSVLVYPGAPVVIGGDRIRTLLKAQRLLDSMVIHWAPADGWLSADGRLGVTYGWTQLTKGTESRKGNYVAGWREENGAWRLVSLVLTAVGPPGRTVLPAGFGPVELPPVAAAGPAREMIQADLDFSATAGSIGAPDAFAKFAAPEAIMPGGGGFRRGPDEIRAGLAGGPPSEWSWFPVVAFASATGDLGLTVGQATIRPKDGGAAAYSKYLTVWRRAPDGQVRYLTDAGNPRPKG